eukprot:1160428-Pelagomonas_calceolata.AAC.9
MCAPCILKVICIGLLCAFFAAYLANVPNVKQLKAHATHQCAHCTNAPMWCAAAAAAPKPYGEAKVQGVQQQLKDEVHAIYQCAHCTNAPIWCAASAPQTYDVAKVQGVLQQLKDEAPEIMLFLKNIECIEVRCPRSSSSTRSCVVSWKQRVHAEVRCARNSFRMGQHHAIFQEH